MASARIIESGKTAGLWVSAQDHTIGIVADDTQGTYICFYPKGKNLPFAIMCDDMDGDKKEDLRVQMPTGDEKLVKNINLSKLLEKLKDL